KGRSRSLPKAELHDLIAQCLGILPGRIVCEYGMSELSSQAYDMAIGEHHAESPGFGSSTVSFPLTPALSLGERGNFIPPRDTPEPFDFAAMWAKELPLAVGEGRGEGKRIDLSSGAATPPTSKGNQDRTFHFPPWARAQVISPETGCEVQDGETGLIRVIDLANVYSVLAIQTEDLGIRRGDGFVLVGRAVEAEPRGCSLMAV
ncbi:MAG: hypothetical protein NT154_04215, partial [Verrucomicrobia bacterium]|nr:hypothetical protein [Verrucomicrobiota bacterium]